MVERKSATQKLFDAGKTIGGPGWKSPERKEMEKRFDDFMLGKRKTMWTDDRQNQQPVQARSKGRGARAPGIFYEAGRADCERPPEDSPGNVQEVIIMRHLNKGEAKVGMTAFYKKMDGTETPLQIMQVQDRGSYDYLSVRQQTKSGKLMNKTTTTGHDELWIP
jgi:hypothetical protein